MNLCRVGLRRRDYAILDRYLEPGIEHCRERDLSLWWSTSARLPARARARRGSWDDAAETAAARVRDAWYLADAVDARVRGARHCRARRGDPDRWAPLDEALALRGDDGSDRVVAPVAVARAEAAWLDGRAELVGARPRTRSARP